MILFGCNGSNGMILLAMFYHELQNIHDIAAKYYSYIMYIACGVSCLFLLVDLI